MTKKVSPEEIRKISSVMKGFTLSQVKEITGMSTASIQNWISRGWVPRPVNKKYSTDHISRIMIIKTLAPVLGLERTSRLLSYVNGDTDDKSDDIVSETELYEYIIKTEECSRSSGTVSQDLEEGIRETLGGYVEKSPGSYERMFKALRIICLAFASSAIREKCLELMKEVERDVPERRQ